jgi:hypothetical protein
MKGIAIYTDNTARNTTTRIENDSTCMVEIGRGPCGHTRAASLTDDVFDTCKTIYRCTSKQFVLYTWPATVNDICVPSSNICRAISRLCSLVRLICDCAKNW